MIALLQSNSVILRPGEIFADAINALGTQLEHIAPLAILTGTSLLVLLADILLRLFRIRRGLPAGGSLSIGLLGSLAAGAYAGWQVYKHWGTSWSYQLFEAIGPPGSTDHKQALQTGFDAIRNWRSGTLIIDQLSAAVAVITCAILAMTFLVLWPYLRRRGLFKAELVPLILLSGCGAVLLGMSRDLLITFIAIEVLSLPLYVLCGIDERRDASRESSLKYFLLGAFASGFFIYGAALIYGAVGHLSYGAIENYFRQGEATAGFNTILLIGISLVGVGLAFKLALVPFQAWLPDVYQGAPTPITAFMASAVKLGVFAAALRFIFDALALLPEHYWRLPLAIFAVASMVVGNLFALHQMSLKRLLAYSAITHTGYLTLSLCVGTSFAAPGMLVYLIGYYLASFGAFALIAYLAPPGQDDVYLDELSELSKRAPGTAASMVILILSMVGMPFTAGFIGKLLVFTDAWRNGLQWLVIVAVLNSVLSAFFYLRVLRSMYMQPTVGGVAQPDTRPMERGYLVPTAIAVGLTLVFGVLPDFVIMFSRGSSPF